MQHFAQYYYSSTPVFLEYSFTSLLVTAQG
jgi:hypothetical protein